MKFYRSWVCRDHRVYQVAQDRPVCPYCGKPMYRAPAAAAHLIFPVPLRTGAETSMSKAPICKQQPPVTASETLGAPKLTVLSSQLRDDEALDAKPKKKSRGRKKKEDEKGG